MANTIGLAQKYLPILDEVYKSAAKTSLLDAPATLVREGMTANTILIPKVALQGLADYDNATGFVDGDVTFEWQSHTFTQNRGRTFSIDAVENMETIDSAFAAVTGQFLRTKVIPEVDAYRFALLADAGITATNTAAAVLAATTTLEAIDTAVAAMEDKEVTMDNVVLYISPTVKKFLKQASLISRQFITNVGSMQLNREVEVLDGIPIFVVPQTRFYTEITQYDGTTTGQEAGGYIKSATGENINFMLVDTTAMLGVTKVALPRIFTPEENQSKHAWKFDFRLYHDLFVPDNKVDGIYVHTVA